jgi:centractin
MDDKFYDVIFKQALVIDNGSGLMKAGLAGEERPSLVFPSFVGRPKYQKVLPGSMHEPEYYVGAEAEQNRGLLKLRYPLKHGIVENWTDMENIWRYIYNQLSIVPQDHPVLLTEAPLNPYQNREKAAEIFFETFSVPGIFMAAQAVLSLYASGVTTGVVLDCGDGVTHCVPVYDGFALSHAVTRIDLAGRDVTEHLILLLRRAGYNFQSSAEFELARQIKEKNCYVATIHSTDDRFLDESSRNVSSYLLPDGRPINLGAEKYRAPEILFSPDKVGLEYPGVQECLMHSIQKADVDLRKTLLSSIYLAGGTTTMPGFAERLLNDMRKMSPKEIKIKIIAPAERKLTCWLGGSILSSLAAFKNMWIKKQEYEEEGKRILHSRSF